MANALETIRHFSNRFKALTDVEMNNIVYDIGKVRYIAATACSVDDTNHAQWEQDDRDGKIRLILTASETLLPALAAGIYVGSGGKERTLMHLQNSGYGDTLDGITSLLATFGIAAGLWVTTRGIKPEDISVPHRNIGRITDSLTRLWFDKESVFGRLDGKRLRSELTKGMARFSDGKNALIRIHPDGFKKTIQPPVVEPREYTTEGLKKNLEALEIIRQRLLEVYGQTPISREEAHDMVIESITENTIVVTGNGFDPRALFSRHHRPLNIYGIGNMGAAKAFAVGIKLANPFLPVVTMEGDQNAQKGSPAFYNLAKYGFSEEELKCFEFDNGHGSSVGTAESLPLLLEHFRFSHVIRTIPEQSGQFKKDRLEDGIPKKYADDRELIEAVGALPFQIQNAMHVIKQETAKVIAKRVEEEQLKEEDIPLAFADYKQYAA